MSGGALDAGAPSDSPDDTSKGVGSSYPDSTGSNSSLPSSGPADGGETGSSDHSFLDAGSGTGPSNSDGGAHETDSAHETDGSTATTEPQDGGPGDAGAVNPWASCPEAVVPTNTAWPVRVNATEDAVYCALFNENRTLVEEKAAKMQLRIAPGVHHVPDVETAALALPACVRDEDDVFGVETGSLSVTQSPGEGNTSYTLGFTQEFGSSDARRLEMRLEQTFDDGATIEFSLNGAETNELESYQSMDLCDVDGEYCFPSIIFASCKYESGELNTHTVEFEGGEVTFDLRIGESFAGTEPGAFVGARGTFGDASFAQSDYFKLIYHPAHHHFERAFVVLFDEPRDGVCGIEVSGLEPFGDDIPDAAHTVDCDLQHIDELEVTSHSLVRGTR